MSGAFGETPGRAKLSCGATDLSVSFATWPAVRPATVVTPWSQPVIRMGQEQFVLAAAPERVYDEWRIPPAKSTQLPYH